MKAYRLRVERNDPHITEVHLADAIEALLETRDRLERSAPAVSSTLAQG